jgi:hypothetical protein
MQTVGKLREAGGRRTRMGPLQEVIEVSAPGSVV